MPLFWNRQPDIALDIKMVDTAEGPHQHVIAKGSKGKPATTVIKNYADIVEAAGNLAQAIGHPKAATDFVPNMQARWRLHTSETEIEPEEPTILEHSELIRPEFFHTPHGTGLTIPVTVEYKGGVGGQWKLYRQSANKRTCETLTQTVSLPDGGGDTINYHVNPMPNDPAPNTEPGWRRQSRDNWLAGQPGIPSQQLISDLADLYSKHIDFTSPGGPTQSQWADTCAVWTILSYTYNIFNTVPYILLQAPPGSGKTALLNLFQMLCYRGYLTSNITPSPLFHRLNEQGGTFLLDEAERLSAGEMREVTNIFLAGYRKGGTATRTEDKVATPFNLYGPKAIAAINHPGSTLASRCITIQLLVRPAGMGQLPPIQQSQERIKSLRDELHILALSHIAPNAQVNYETPDTCPFQGRPHDLWAPMLSIAHAIDTQEQLRDALMAVAHYTLTTANQDRLPEADLQILQSARTLQTQGRSPTADAILQAAKTIQADVVRGLSPRGVSEIMKRYGLNTTKSGGRHEYRFNADTFINIERRFAIEIPADLPKAKITTKRY